MAAEKHRTGKTAAVKEGPHKSPTGSGTRRAMGSADKHLHKPSTPSARGYTAYKKYSF